jgi:hypothetical protein
MTRLRSLRGFGGLDSLVDNLTVLCDKDDPDLASALGEGLAVRGRSGSFGCSFPFDLLFTVGFLAETGDSAWA